MDTRDGGYGKVSVTREKKHRAGLSYRSDEETDENARGSQPFIKTAAIKACGKPVNFCDLPTSVQRKIISNLSDEDLWLRRDLSRTFYRSFFEQKVVQGKRFNSADWDPQMSRKFHCYRAIRLANMGRVFKNVEYLFII